MASCPSCSSWTVCEACLESPRPSLLAASMQRQGERIKDTGEDDLASGQQRSASRVGISSWQAGEVFVISLALACDFSLPERRTVGNRLPSLGTRSSLLVAV